MDIWIEDARMVQDAMVCSVVFGVNGQKALTVRDTWVRMKNDGSSLWFKFPEKPRMKNGEAVKGPDGYPIRDEMVTIYLDPEQKKPTKPAFQLKDAILAAITETWDGLKGVSAGVGSRAKPAIKTAAPPAGVKTSAKPQRPAGMGAARAPQVMSDVGDDEDDDLPF